MKANTLISKHILPLSLSDHIDTALEKMIEFKVLQLYVLLDQKIIGKVTWQKLSKHNGKESIQQFLETDFQHVSSEDYIFDIWSKNIRQLFYPVLFQKRQRGMKFTFPYK